MTETPVMQPESGPPMPGAFPPAAVDQPQSVGTDEPGELYEDYWGTDEIKRHYLPDGKQYFEFKIMDEGARSRFQKLTNEDMTVMRDNTAKVKMDPVAQRHTLIKESVIGWFLMQRLPDGSWSEAPPPTATNKRPIEQWLEKAPPKIVDELEFAIRKANAWMQADMSAEDIDKEIERLYDLRKQVVEREAGEGTSGSK
jgi:hypothetical protein